MTAKTRTRPADRLARAERQRLLAAERRERERARHAAVQAGVAETAALLEARGAALVRPTARRGEREKPIRRMGGLAWLFSKGRITARQAQAGARYGAAWRDGQRLDALRSSLADPDRVPGAGRPLGALIAEAERHAAAAERLAAMRARLSGQKDLIRACDLVCGAEMTPREASRNGTEAAKIEAVLVVALSLLEAG